MSEAWELDLACGRGLGTCKTRCQDCELVAAESRDHVAIAHRGGQPLCDNDEHFIADAMPMDVAELLEAVDVEQKHAVRHARAGRWGDGSFRASSNWRRLGSPVKTS